MQRQRLFKPYLWLISACGGIIFVFSVLRLASTEFDPAFLILGTITVLVASRIVVNLYRFKSSISASDTFVFLALLLFGTGAAVIIGAAESFYSSRRITKKPLTMLFNAAAMACSTLVTGLVLEAVFGSIGAIRVGEYSSMYVVATCTMAVVQYIVNSVIIAIASALRNNQPVWATYRKHYVWTSITYFAGASGAGITARLISLYGIYASIAVLPIIAVVYFTYLTYVKNVQSSSAQAESEKRFHQAFYHAPIGMALVGTNGHWLQVNQSLCQIVGYREEELIKLALQDIACKEDLGAALGHLENISSCNSLTAQFEVRFIHKAGHAVWVAIGISMLTDAEGESQHFIFQMQDITDRKKAEEQLKYDAYHDALTGLANRAWFMEKLQESISHRKHHTDSLVAVLFIDLDRFKIINDSLGHHIGDELLIGIAKRIKESVRPGDHVARLGGDEFTILLAGLKTMDEVLQMAERLQKEIAKPFDLGGYETFTTVSIGIAISDSGDDQPQELLRDADTAMYCAKSLGNAQQIVFNKAMHTRALVLLQLETDLRRAVERGEFFIEYQPIVHLQTGSLTGFEALVRWRHPQRGLVPPDEFIAIAEETGLIIPIGNWVLEAACKQFQQWQNAYAVTKDLIISVNLSCKQFAQKNLLDRIITILAETEVDPHRLKLEITETVVMENIELATPMLEKLRTIGVELSIDDFGTGYSSLSYLHRLPIDTLKIDRSFVKSSGDNKENREIVKTIVTLAQTLGLGVIAEGVETEEQLDWLRELGCDHGQGFLFSRPLNAVLAEGIINEACNGSAIVPLFERYRKEEADLPLISNYSM